ALRRSVRSRRLGHVAAEPCGGGAAEAGEDHPGGEDAEDGEHGMLLVVGAARVVLWRRGAGGVRVSVGGGGAPGRAARGTGPAGGLGGRGALGDEAGDG